MSDAVTYGIEAAVGLACLVAGFSVRRRSGLRLVAALLGIAGVAAVAHAASSLI
jgi:hypothetical protein